MSYKKLEQRETCKCGSQIRRTYKGMCWKCYIKTQHRIGLGKPCMSLEKALDKTYEIRSCKKSNGAFFAFKSFPSILIGHKVRVGRIKWVKKF